MNKYALPKNINPIYVPTFIKKFNCGPVYENSLCHIIRDHLQKIFIIQFHRGINPGQRLIIPVDIMRNIPFDYILALIEHNFRNIIQFRAIDYFKSDIGNELVTDFSSAETIINHRIFTANLTFEQAIAVSFMHIEKLYLDNGIKTNLRRALLEIIKDYE